MIAQASKTRIENPPVIGRFSCIPTRRQHRSSASCAKRSNAGVEFTNRVAHIIRIVTFAASVPHLNDGVEFTNRKWPGGAQHLSNANQQKRYH